VISKVIKSHSKTFLDFLRHCIYIIAIEFFIEYLHMQKNNNNKNRILILFFFHLIFED